MCWEEEEEGFAGGLLCLCVGAGWARLVENEASLCSIHILKFSFIFCKKKTRFVLIQMYNYDFGIIFCEIAIDRSIERESLTKITT